MNYYSTPLEQFEIISIIPIFTSKNVYLNITNNTLFNFIGLESILLIFYFLKLKTKVIPTR